MLPQGVLQALLEQSSEWLVVSDAQGRIGWASPAFIDATGWSRCIGAALPPCLEPADTGAGPALQARLAAGLAAGRLEDTEVQLRLPGAPARHWLRLRIGQAQGMRLWTLRDIGAERQAQAASRRLGELLETAQEFGRLGVWERDIATGRGHWDHHIFRFWGLDPADGTPDYQDATEFIHPEDRQSRVYAESTRRTGRYAQRYRVQQRDGSLRWIHSQWEIKAGPDGAPQRAVGVMVDDTEVIALARSLDDATAQLSLAVELGQIAVWRHDLKTNLVYYNPRAFDVLGMPYRPEGMSIEEVRSWIHPDDLPGVLTAAARALREPSAPTDMEARYRRVDGSWRHVLTRRVLQQGERGEPLAFIGVALDVSDQVEQQRQAADLTRRLEFATTAAGIGLWSRDPQTGEGHWNAQMYELCGRSPGLGPPTRDEWFHHIVHPDDLASMKASQAGLVAGSGEVIEQEYRAVLPGGALRWLANRVSLELWNGRQLLFGATLDISERRAAAQALRQANDRIALATRGAGIGSWEHDLRSGELRWDAQMYRLRGSSAPTDPQEALAAPARLRQSLAHPDELPLLLEANRQACEAHRMASYEFRVRWPDGSYRWLASRSVFDYDADGTPLRQIGLNWDIHERVAAEAARREALVAQRQNEAKSQLLARMSHELRTPLNAILGFTQLLELDAASPEGASASRPGEGVTGRGVKLRHIREAADHLLTLVNEVLDLTSLEGGNLPIALGPVAIDPLLAAAVGALEPDAARRAVRLQLDPSGLSSWADAQRLGQVVRNLIQQRLPMIPFGGILQLSAIAGEGELALSLVDDGECMGPAEQLNLFDPFGWVGTNDQPDAGVRLALVKSLLAGMGGRIELVDRGGGGIHFLVRVPSVPAAAEGLAASLVMTQQQAGGREESPVAPMVSAAPAERRRGRVLYIEDNPVNVILVEELLAQRGGIDLLTEPDGTRGVERARQWQPDLVLIDMQLPDFDGVEVLRRLRTDPLTAGARCIALSANAMPEDVARALASGFDDYWTKPIRFDSFLAGLDRLFPREPAA
jgi:PAS domain S-box-containing protein